MSDQQVICGFGWYRPEQWERLLEISDDRDDLESTYDEWQASASKTIAELHAEGLHVKKVNINLEELLFWCNDKQVSVNGKSRAEYVTYVLSRQQP